MISLDRSALFCDLAETYGILDWKTVPTATLAVLAVGLRGNSRIKMRLEERAVPVEQLLMAAVLDRLSMLVWFQTEDGEKGINRPKSMAAILLGDTQEIGGDVQSFETTEEFEQQWQRVTGVAHG